MFSEKLNVKLYSSFKKVNSVGVVYFKQPSYNPLSHIGEIMLKFLQKWEHVLVIKRLSFITENIFKCNPLH